MNELTIRKADLTDLHLISVLAITTCYEAYFELDPSDQIADYCINSFHLQQLTDEIENPNSTFLIAELDGKAVGFAKLREGKKIKCMEGRNAIEVQRIYLLEKAKRKNIGRRMIESCVEIGREKGYETLWLGVWEKNLAAQEFYKRLGMNHIGLTDFSDGKTEFVNMVFAIDIEPMKL